MTVLLNRASLIVLAALALGGGVARAQPAPPSDTVPSQALPPVNRRPDATPPAAPADSNPLPTVNSPPAGQTPQPQVSPAQQIYSPSPSAAPPRRAPKTVAPKPETEEPTYVLSVKGKVVAGLFS